MKKIVFVCATFYLFLFLQNCVNPGNPPNDGTVVSNNCPDPPVRVPIDRIRLKGSPRAIITWSSDTRRDTSGAFWNQGTVKFSNMEDGVKVTFITPAGEDVPMIDIQEESMKTQVGLFSYRYLDGEMKDQITIISNQMNGDDFERIKLYFFKVKDEPPYVEQVSVEPPHMAHYEPDTCYMNMYYGRFEFYKDSLFLARTRQLKYSNEVVSGSEY